VEMILGHDGRAGWTIAHDDNAMCELGVSERADLKFFAVFFCGVFGVGSGFTRTGCFDSHIH
jgi:hypothetical protein